MTTNDANHRSERDVTLDRLTVRGRVEVLLRVGPEITEPVRVHRLSALSVFGARVVPKMVPYTASAIL